MDNGEANIVIPYPGGPYVEVLLKNLKIYIAYCIWHDATMRNSSLTFLNVTSDIIM